MSSTFASQQSSGSTPSKPVVEALTIGQIKERVTDTANPYVVRGFLPASDICVAVGDSGRGKTPLAYQLGICIAAGMPFLGMPTTQTRVVYLDMENGQNKLPPLTEDICKVVQLETVPDDFLVIGESCDFDVFSEAIRYYRPGIVIVDTLRALCPEAEDRNSLMGEFLKSSRRIAQAFSCAILYIHHVNKPREEDVYRASLANTPVMEWLYRASGARALINQSNARIGIDTADESAVKNAALVMKWFVKLEGESDNLYVERVLDDDGNPIGYRRLQGIDLLANPEQQAAFERLPKQFAFKEAMQVYGRSDKPTSQYLQKCIAAGILIHPERRGPYEKVDVRVE